MNISHILASLDDSDRKKFCKAIADTLTYTNDALDTLPESVSDDEEVGHLLHFYIWLDSFHLSLTEAMAKDATESEEVA